MIAVLDTETTGLDPHKHEVIQIAAIGTDDKLLPQWAINVLCHPDRPQDAEPEAMRINRYDPDTWERRGAVSRWKAINTFRRMTRNHIPAGQCVAFDLAFLDVMATRHRCRLSFGNSRHAIDSCSLAAAIKLQLQRSLRGSRSLGPMLDLLGIDRGHHHDAIFDATASLYLIRVATLGRFHDEHQTEFAALYRCINRLIEEQQ